MKRSASPIPSNGKRPKLEFISKEERGRQAAHRVKSIDPVVLSKADASLIKDRYMGGAPTHRKVTNTRKINFGWDEADDTTLDDPLYDLMVHKTSKKDELDFVQNYNDKHYSDMTKRDWKLFREEYNISLKNSEIPPIRSWNESQLNRHLIELLKDLNLNTPTPIQRQAVPVGLNKSDIIGLSMTGSGKTLAFLLPALQLILDAPKLTDDTKYDGPYVLVVTPTRELSQQIESYGAQFCKALGLTCLSLIGGHNMQQQSFKFRDGAHLVIATPGRLIDTLQQGILSLNQCCMVILDECDKMIDFGFRQSVQQILSHVKCPAFYKQEKPQMLLFSATLPPDLEQLTAQYLVNPAIIKVGTANVAVSSVQQIFEQVFGDSDKKQKLIKLVKNQRPPIIIFVNMKGQADALVKMIKKVNIPCVALHGGKSQDQRESAIASFKNKKVDVLVTTDVAGRGLDVENVQMVINYDMARDMTIYTHRIGRTGRNGQTGKSVSFIYKDDDLTALKQYLKKSNTQLPRFMDLE